MAEYSATAEPVSGLLVRLHPDGGVPYDAVCVVVPDGDDPLTAVVKGFKGATSLGHGRALDRLLRSLGYARMRYERRKGPAVVWVTREL